MTDLYSGGLVDSLADTGEVHVPTLVSDRSRPEAVALWVADRCPRAPRGEQPREPVPPRRDAACLGREPLGEHSPGMTSGGGRGTWHPPMG